MNVLASSNRLLARLTRCHPSLLPHLRQITLGPGQMLAEPGQPVDTIYFPATCLVTKMGVSNDHREVEVGTVGREGMTGSRQVLDGGPNPLRALVRIGGRAVVLPAAVFRQAVHADGQLHREVSRYRRRLLQRISDVTACDRRHPLGQRVARWLLLASDGVASPELPVTHEELARAVGGSRPRVTAVARGFAQRDLIRYHHGPIRVLDRGGLEGEACGCYRLIRYAPVRSQEDDQSVSGAG